MSFPCFQTTLEAFSTHLPDTAQQQSHTLMIFNYLCLRHVGTDIPSHITIAHNHPNQTHYFIYKHRAVLNKWNGSYGHTAPFTAALPQRKPGYLCVVIHCALEKGPYRGIPLTEGPSGALYQAFVTPPFVYLPLSATYIIEHLQAAVGCSCTTLSSHSSD